MELAKQKRKILISLIAVGFTIILYSIFLWDAAASDFNSFAATSPQYVIKAFTNLGADEQSFVPDKLVTEKGNARNSAK